MNGADIYKFIKPHLGEVLHEERTVGANIDNQINIDRRSELVDCLLKELYTSYRKSYKYGVMEPTTQSIEKELKRIYESLGNFMESHNIID